MNITPISADLVLIDRIDLQPDSTRSKVYIFGEPTRFVALEDIVKDGPKVHGHRAIPANRYQLGLEFSPKFSHEYYTADDVNLISRNEWAKLLPQQRDKYHQHDVITVLNVPNYKDIRQHWGNIADDTDGCTLIGSRFGKIGVNNAVLASRDAYVKYYAQVAPVIRKGNQYIEFRNSFA